LSRADFGAKKAWGHPITPVAAFGSRSVTASSTRFTTGTSTNPTARLQFLISDGETFCHEESATLTHAIRLPGTRLPLLPPNEFEPGGRYRVVNMSSPIHISRFPRAHKVEVLDESLRGKLRLYALLAPHIAGYGAGNSGWCSEVGNIKLIRAQRENVTLSWRAPQAFSPLSVTSVSAMVGRSHGQFPNGLGFPHSRGGQHRLTGDIHLRPPMNSRSLWHFAAVTRVQPQIVPNVG